MTTEAWWASRRLPHNIGLLVARLLGFGLSVASSGDAEPSFQIHVFFLI
jgi:hypothetical protein